MQIIVFADALSVLVPSIIIVLILANTDFNSQKYQRDIVCALTTIESRTSQSEELLILLYHCNISTHSFGVFDISFATFGKVKFT